MEEARGVVKHVLLVKFKDNISPEQIEDLIKGFANLVNHIEPMKAFHWGKNVSVENLNQVSLMSLSPHLTALKALQSIFHTGSMLNL